MVRTYKISWRTWWRMPMISRRHWAEATAHLILMRLTWRQVSKTLVELCIYLHAFLLLVDIRGHLCKAKRVCRQSHYSGRTLIGDGISDSLFMWLVENNYRFAKIANNGVCWHVQSWMLWETSCCSMMTAPTSMRPRQPPPSQKAFQETSRPTGYFTFL